jgi:hypothetical protein
MDEYGFALVVKDHKLKSAIKDRVHYKFAKVDYEVPCHPEFGTLQMDGVQVWENPPKEV